MDPLTGLLTRHEMMPLIDAELERKGSFSIALLDLDFFKAFNDKHGHDMGDLYIAKAADVLKKNLSATAQVARYGGEEFCILLPETPPESAFLLLEETRRLLSETQFVFKHQDRKVESKIALSGGIAGSPRDGKQTGELLRAADEALYRAKIAGRNRLNLAVSEKMKTKTSYYTQAQLQRLSSLSDRLEISEAVLLRQSLDELLYSHEA